MIKFVTIFIMKIIIFALIGGCTAFMTWYFFSARTTENLSEILFWFGIATIAVGVFLFHGDYDIGLAPEEIDPQDKADAKSLRRHSEMLLLMISLAGALLLFVSWLFT